MKSMFKNCTSLESLDINNFNTSKVINMNSMFYGCSSLISLFISDFDTLNLISMSDMFRDCSSLISLNLSKFKTSNVENMMNLFNGCKSLISLDITNFDTTKVTNMISMFSECYELKELDITNFITINVKEMNSMFKDCRSLASLNINNFDTTQVTIMDNMFLNCFSLLDLNLNNFIMTSVNSMEYMFSNCKLLRSVFLPIVADSSVINLSHIFSGCSSLTSLDLSKFDSSKVIYMDYMFSDCSFLSFLNLENFQTSSAENMQFMFSGCTSLKTLYLSSFDTQNVKFMNGMFYNCASLLSLDLSKFETNSVVNMAFMFYGMKSATSIDISKFNTEKVIYIYYMFDGCESVTSIEIMNLDLKNAKIMDNIFSNCHSLKYINIINLDTSTIESTKYLFYNCHSLTTINLENFDTSRTTTFEKMFSGCSSLEELDLSCLDISTVNNMEYIFSNCSSLKNIDLSNINTSNVENMGHLFNGCSNLTSINLENFNTSAVKKMDYMFAGCSSLTNVITSSFDTSLVTDMGHMFENCTSLISLNLSNFETPNVQNIESFFSGNSKLAYISLDNIVDIRMSNMNNILSRTMENMFFCFNTTKALSLTKIINQKGCSIINCTSDPLEERKLIVAKTEKCVEKCEKDYKYLYDYKCYERCPDGLVSVDFVCKETYTRNESECKIKDFFRHYCNKDLKTPFEKQKFIDETIKKILSSELYDLVVLALDYQEVLTIKEINETYQLYMLSNKIRVPETSYIDLDECGKILKDRYDIPQEEDLLIFKIEYRSPDFRIPIIEYTIFDQEGIEELNINYCKNEKVNYFIYKDFNFQDYIYNPINKYYNDRCDIFTAENGRDILLYDRRDEFNKNNISICESLCIFKRYENKYIECECKIKNKFNSFMNVNDKKYNLIHRFENLKLNLYNFWVIKCYYLVLSKENLLSNICGLIIAAIIFINLILLIIFRAYEYNVLLKKIQFVYKATIQNIGPNFFNQPNNIKTVANKFSFKKIETKNNFNRIIKYNYTKSPNLSQSNGDPKSSSNIIGLNKINNNNILKRQINDKVNNNTKNSKKNIKTNANVNVFQDYMKRTDNELNFLSFEEAIKIDKRKCCQYYLSLIRTKQILVFTFNQRNDFNSHIIKILFLFTTFSTTLTMTALFINDEFIHNLYISNGKFDIVSNIKISIYICIIIYIIQRIGFIFMFTEKNVIELKYNKERNAIIQILFFFSFKFLMFFFINIFLNLVFLIYISCFSVVFKNTQIHLLINTFISLGILFIIPFIINIFPAAIRIYSLDKKNISLYLFSKFLQNI